MSYFWSAFIQPLYDDEEENQPQSRKQQQRVQPPNQVQSKQEERDLNASIPTADAFKPKYVTRKPKLNVDVPPPPPPSTPQELEDGECTPTGICTTTTRKPESVFNSTVDLYEYECCTPTNEPESKFVFDSESIPLLVDADTTSVASIDSVDTLVFNFNSLELNKYNIQAECTPQNSTYNSPRISVDKLHMFNWEPKYTTVNHGMFKNTMVNGGRVQPRSLPSSPVVKRQRTPSVSLSDVQYNLQSGIQELARLQKQFESISIQILDLQTNLY
jgi:hypothetical protein